MKKVSKKKVSATNLKTDNEDSEESERESPRLHEKASSNNEFWKEFLSIMSGVCLVIISYSVILYLSSYSKSECPL
jgi:hypothetical protein